MGYNAPYSYGGYTYNRKDALQVKGPYYVSVNASYQSGSFSSNTTKYFYGYYTNDDGSSVSHPLALMNYQSNNSATFGFMDMSAIQSGGTANTYTMTMYHRKYNPSTGNWDHFKTTTASAKYGTVFTPPYSETPTGHYNYSRDWNGGWTVSGNGSFYVNYHPNSYTMTSYHHKWNPVSSQWVHYSTTTASALYGTTYTPPWQTPSYHYNYSRDWDGGWTVSGNGGFSLYYYPNSYSFDLNGYLDGAVYGDLSNYGTADVIVNGTKVADDVADWCTSYPYGSTWQVTDIKATTGHTYNGLYSGALSGTITNSPSHCYLNFTTNSYYLDVNGRLDGTILGNTSGFGTFDVYINGSLVANDVNDYYAQHPYGTTWEVKDVKALSGYTYNGWHSGGMSGTITGNVVSVQDFSTNSYTLTVNPNGGTWNGSTSTQSFTQAFKTTKALPLPTRTGYRFVGWQDLGSGWTYDSNNDNICFENGVGNITTYCNANDGSVSITREAMSTPTGSGYGLKIYFNSSAQTAWGWGFVDSEQSEANTTFIHVFQAKVPKGYTLQYAYNSCGDGATRRWLTPNVGTGDWATYAYETKCGSSGSFGTFGYVYLTGGSVPVTWYLASSNIYKSTGSTFYYSSGNGSLKAIWAPNRYTITYNANGGYSTPNTTSTSQVITYDETFSFKNREYTKPGYVHIGWNTKADGSGTKYAIGLSTTYTTAGDLTVYAQWRAATAEEQKIYLYNNGYCEAINFAKTSDWYGFKKGVVGAKDFTIGSPATSPSHTMQFKGMIVKNLT